MAKSSRLSGHTTPQLYSAVSFKAYKMELMPLTVMLPL
ncbi:Cell wall surface anchor family protein [Lactococcus lactis subsp. lactis]|nr:Cell wall surface anchor family protein [Lactococcus lactis subsp. lactis]KSU33086.1 Cell wall surface anchor family protein [Lactococcus lactis subsp. lactis]